MWFNFLLFLITTASITYGLTRSKGFKPLREWATKKNKEINYPPSVENKKPLKNPFYWFLNHFFSCYYCNGLYVSMGTWLLLNHQLYFVCYAFSGALFTLISITIINKIKE